MIYINIPPGYWGNKQGHKARQAVEAGIIRQVSQYLLVRQRGDMYSPQTWLDIAQASWCRTVPFHEPGGPWGDYCPASDGWGVLTYNTSLTPPRQARVVVHELSHHLCMGIVPGFVLSDQIKCNYDDDPMDVRQRIARGVEDICLKRL